MPKFTWLLTSYKVDHSDLYRLAQKLIKILN